MSDTLANIVKMIIKTMFDIAIIKKISNMIMILKKTITKTLRIVIRMMIVRREMMITKRTFRIRGTMPTPFVEFTIIFVTTVIIIIINPIATVTTINANITTTQ